MDCVDSRDKMRNYKRGKDLSSAFFIPGVPHESWEQAYAEMAAAIGRPIPSIGERVQSVTFSHNGEVWTATVGERLTGSVTKVKTVRRQRIERSVPLSNPSIVMAIFPGVPLHVWHDGQSRAWANPFLTGEPISMTRFSE